MIELHEQEAELTPLYAAAAARHLLLAIGARSIFEPTEMCSYGARHQRAIEVAMSRPRRQVIYFACHLNAGNGDYGAFFFAEGRDKDESLARLLADSFRRLPELKRSLVFPAAPSGWTERARYCIDGLINAPGNLTAIVLEPAFMDTPAHLPLLQGDGLARIALCISDAVIRYCGEVSD